MTLITSTTRSWYNIDGTFYSYRTDMGNFGTNPPGIHPENRSSIIQLPSLILMYIQRPRFRTLTEGHKTASMTFEETAGYKSHLLATLTETSQAEIPVSDQFHRDHNNLGDTV